MTRRILVVGGGGSGAPLAARLSEDPGIHVTLLEAGPAPATAAGFPRALLDAGTVVGAAPGHPANWSFPAQLAPDRPYDLARGRIIGGSTTINGGAFVRARPEDFDRWAAAGGDRWSYAKVLPVLRDLETDLDFGPSRFHGDAGPMPVRRASQEHPIAVGFTAAAIELGFAPCRDLNAPGPPGVGAMPRNVVDGVRVNTALAYLAPARARPNLEVIGGCRVLRVVVERGRAVGVEVHDEAGTDEVGNVQVRRADEIVLCAGAIGTARLLLASGLGPADDLRRLGVPVVVDAPGVGRGFSDHPQLTIGFGGRPGYAELDRADPFPTALHLTSDGSWPPGDLEILACTAPSGRLLGGWAPDDDAGPGDPSLLVALQREEARGTITLASADPTAAPRIASRYLSTDGDRRRLRHGVRTAVDLLRTRAFGPFLGAPPRLDPDVAADDRALDAWMLAHLGTALHLCGSARMGSADDPSAVVDGEGRVHGIDGLRVADTSMLPEVPARGPANTAVLIGELAARSIREG